MPRKRTHDEMASSEPVAAPTSPPPPENELLRKLRSMWEFAAFFEWMHIFGHVVKIQPIDIEDFEQECIKPEPSKFLEETGLAILKFVSSRRDLTLENWDETVRRQYEYKREGMPHPYGYDEESVNRFHDFHVFTKLRVLYQLAVWTFHNPDRMRQHFPDLKEQDMFYDWQAHPIGFDRRDNPYFSLHGRLYRRTDPVPPPEKTKAKLKYTSKKAQAQRRRERAAKRRKIEPSEDGDTEMADGDETINETELDADTHAEPTMANTDPEQLNTFGEYKWECLAITLDDFKSFIASIAKSRDELEQELKARIEEDMIPELEKARERRERKEAERLKELQMAEKLLGAKRSGRLAAKQEREREEAEAAEAERQRQALLAEARREEERQHKRENERHSRMLTREQRIREREYKRVLMEEQLARDSEEERRIEQEGGARSARQLKERIKKSQQELNQWEGDEWTFDCSGCSQHGKNFDDGEHSIACERCNVWQHSKCLGFSKSAAESDDFHFVCGDCRRKEDDADRPKISLKFKVGQSPSPPQQHSTLPVQAHQESPVKKRRLSVDLPPVQRPSVSGSVVNGQFYPAAVPSRAAPPAPAPPMAPVTQPSMPAYAQKQINRGLPYMNGGHPNAYPPYNGYAPNPAQSNYSYNQASIQQPAPPQYQTHAPYQQQLPPLRPASSHSHTPRPPSSHSLVDGHSSPIRQRIPSPIVNRPTMSPTQGNPDVGPIAGIPGSSPLMQPVSMNTPFTNGHGHHTNGNIPLSTPHQPQSRHSSFSASQGTQPISGLSPTKQRPPAPISPLPQPSLVPQKQRQGDDTYATPSSSFNNEDRMRSVSGTPIFPPAEKLAPSPHQLNREPVPTPSKQSPPLPQSSFESDPSQQAQQQAMQQLQPPHPHPSPQPQPGTVQ